MKFGSPIVGGHMPYTGPSRQLRERPADEHCIDCGRASYTRGCTGARVNPLTDGRCSECVAGWACVGCGSRHPFDELSEEFECGRCFVARMAREEAA